MVECLRHHIRCVEVNRNGRLKEEGFKLEEEAPTTAAVGEHLETLWQANGVLTSNLNRQEKRMAYSV